MYYPEVRWARHYCTPYYRRGLDFLQKLRFDWATSVTTPASPIIRTFFPNPCAGQGIFEYDVPGVQAVNLVLYDLNGHRLRHLSSGRQSGPQRVPFDCGSLPAGTYYCVLFLGAQKFSQQVQIGAGGIR